MFRPVGTSVDMYDCSSESLISSSYNNFGEFTDHVKCSVSCMQVPDSHAQSTHTSVELVSSSATCRLMTLLLFSLSFPPSLSPSSGFGDSCTLTTLSTDNSPASWCLSLLPSVVAAVVAVAGVSNLIKLLLSSLFSSWVMFVGSSRVSLGARGCW